MGTPGGSKKVGDSVAGGIPQNDQERVAATTQAIEEGEKAWAEFSSSFTEDAEPDVAAKNFVALAKGTDIYPHMPVWSEETSQMGVKQIKHPSFDEKTGQFKSGKGDIATALGYAQIQGFFRGHSGVVKQAIVAKLLEGTETLSPHNAANSIISKLKDPTQFAIYTDPSAYVQELFGDDLNPEKSRQAEEFLTAIYAKVGGEGNTRGALTILAGLDLAEFDLAQAEQIVQNLASKPDKDKKSSDTDTTVFDLALASMAGTKNEEGDAVAFLPTEDFQRIQDAAQNKRQALAANVADLTADLASTLQQPASDQTTDQSTPEPFDPQDYLLTALSTVQHQIDDRLNPDKHAGHDHSGGNQGVVLSAQEKIALTAQLAWLKKMEVQINNGNVPNDLSPLGIEFTPEVSAQYAQLFATQQELEKFDGKFFNLAKKLDMKGLTALLDMEDPVPTLTEAGREHQAVQIEKEIDLDDRTAGLTTVASRLTKITGRIDELGKGVTSPLNTFTGLTTAIKPAVQGIRDFTNGDLFDSAGYSKIKEGMFEDIQTQFKEATTPERDRKKLLADKSQFTKPTTETKGRGALMAKLETLVKHEEGVKFGDVMGSKKANEIKSGDIKNKTEALALKERISKFAARPPRIRNRY